VCRPRTRRSHPPWRHRPRARKAESRAPGYCPKAEAAWPEANDARRAQHAKGRSPHRQRHQEQKRGLPCEPELHSAVGPPRKSARCPQSWRGRLCSCRVRVARVPRGRALSFRGACRDSRSQNSPASPQGRRSRPSNPHSHGVCPSQGSRASSRAMPPNRRLP